MDTSKLLDEFLLKQEAVDQEFHNENAKIKPLLAEIGYIKNQSIQYFVRSLLVKAHEFWFAPADNVEGHPTDEYDVGGMVLHTQRVVRTAMLLSEAYGLEEHEKDLVIAAAILHDITKALILRGDEDMFYDPMHPYTVDAFLKSVSSEDKMFGDESKSSTMYLKEESIAQIMRLIRCHLGLYSPVPETIPITTTDMVVHLADLVATNLETLQYGESSE